ncbi:hypothetical protein GQ600_26114 [Phytophthora cactorum]|nr:hypothetical protein GQ600_26114 [Phytophthora cactorum]
MFVTKQQEIEW